jgi:serine/threonine protein kinase
VGGVGRQITERKPTSDGVVELAHVAGPVVGLEPMKKIYGQRGVAPAKSAPKIAPEDRNVASPPSQRRKLDAGHREAKEQIVAESSLLHLTIEIPSGGRKHAHIDLEPAIATDPLHLAALDGTQELGLECDVEIPHLVDQERPAVSLLEDSLPRGDGSREGATLVAEERRLDQAGRNGGAIEHHERLARPSTGLVNRLGQKLLARPRLALEDHGYVAGCEPFAQRVEPPHLGAGANDAAESQGIGECGGRRSCISLQPERGLAEVDGLATHQVSLDHAETVDGGSVGGTEIGHPQAGGGGLEGHVTARHHAIGQSQLACGTLAHQGPRRTTPVDAEEGPGIGSFHHAHDIAACTFGLIRSPWPQKGLGVLCRASRAHVTNGSKELRPTRPPKRPPDRHPGSRRTSTPGIRYTPGMPPEAPKVLGRYALFGPIASGGMATVHFGRLIGPVGFARTVAIKRLHPHLASDPEFVTLLLDEARLAGRIRHPNVVSTVDVVAAEGELLIVMEYVEGESLARLARMTRDREQRVPPQLVSAILAGVLHGLHAAHEALGDQGEPLDIVHRDVSPQNIVVGVDGLSRVLDFGVAKAASRLQTTREGQVKGKLAYMAPEQVRGGKVSRRTDVYAAGVVLWEALTGARLFSGDNDGMVLEQVLLGVVDPPSSLVPSLPVALDDLVLRATAHDPAARFATAREMAVALEHACPPALASELGEWVARTAAVSLKERTVRVAAIESTPVHSTGSTSGPPPYGSAGRGAIVLGVALVGVVAGVFVAGRRLGMATAAPSPSAAASISAPLASIPVTESAPATESAGVASSAPPPATSPRAPVPSINAGHAPGPAHVIDCKVPYTRDADGHIVWKRQCL